MLTSELAATIARQWEVLPDRLAGHVFLSLVALAVGILISIPLGIWASRHPRVEHVALMAASIIQTVPSLALLAIMVFAFGRIGWMPALVALVLYSVLPMLRNTITGLEGVDPAYVEAARGVGMTGRQMLWLVELPLAAPTILAGVRTATVWVVGLATIAQPVGATSLGNYIFVGLQTSNSTALLFGCVFSAILALVLDGLLHGAEVAARRRSLRGGAAVLAGLAAVVVMPLALSAFQSDAPLVASQGSGPAEEETDGRPIVVGGKAFTEQYILTEAIASRLEETGFEVERHGGLGSTILFEALRRGEIDCYVDYTGTIWATIMHRTDTASGPETLVDVATYLKQECGVICLGPLGFDNSYAFAMRRPQAEELGIETIADLVPHAREMTAGTDVEFFARPEWQRVQELYGLEFGKRRTMDATLMYGAIAAGQLDVVAAYGTDGRIAANDLLVLEDPKQALPPYDAVLLVSQRVARNPRAVAALRPLVGTISTDHMRHANMLVDVQGRPPAEAAGRLVRGRKN